jgi:two-component sensor histidine kinase
MSYKKPGLQIQTHIHVDHVVLPLEQATPCSLILNEIISNAFKYEFTGQESGDLQVSFVQEKEQYVLTIKNDGKTMPNHAVESETFGLGMKITQALVQQLKGTLDIQHSGGTTFRIQFPKMNTSVPPRF